MEEYASLKLKNENFETMNKCLNSTIKKVQEKNEVSDSFHKGKFKASTVELDIEENFKTLRSKFQEVLERNIACEINLDKEKLDLQGSLRWTRYSTILRKSKKINPKIGKPWVLQRNRIQTLVNNTIIIYALIVTSLIIKVINTT